MNVWITNRKRLLAEQPPANPNFKAAYDFARDWLAGRTEFLLHTSGSSGTPKPILIQRTQMEASARMTGNALDLRDGTRALLCLNTGYIAGRMMLVRALVLEWEIIMVEPSANPLADLDPSIHFDFVAMVPLQLTTCIQNEETRGRLKHCGKILLGGAPISKKLEAETQQLGVPVYQSYGMTETVSHVALRRVNGPERTDAYRILDGVDFGLDGRECLWVRGAVTNFETVQTNDRVALKAGRSFQWLGRADSVVNSGGVKLHLDALDRVGENILGEMEVTNAFFLWGQPDEKLGEKLVLFIEKNPCVVNTTELLAKFAAQAGAYEVPKAVYLVDGFARTPTAKIDKRATAQAYFTTNSPQ